MTKHLPPSPPITPPELLETCGKSTMKTNIRSGFLSASVPVLEHPVLKGNSSSCCSEENDRNGFLPPSPPAPAPPLPIHPASVLPVPQEADLYKKLVSCGSLAEYIQLVASSYTAREAAENIKSVERTFLERTSPKNSKLSGQNHRITEFPPAHKSAFYSPLSVKTSDYWQEREQYLRSCYLSNYFYPSSAADKSISSSCFASTAERINYHLSSGCLLQRSAVDLRVGVGNSQEEEDRQDEKSGSAFFRPWEKGKFNLIVVEKVKPMDVLAGLFIVMDLHGSFPDAHCLSSQLG